MTKSSQISGFYKLPPEERVRKVAEFAGLTDEDVETLKSTGSLDMELADRMIENVVGTHELPIGIGMNFLINGKDYMIPMSVEEPSIVAAASNTARHSSDSQTVQGNSPRQRRKLCSLIPTAPNSCARRRNATSGRSGFIQIMK